MTEVYQDEISLIDLWRIIVEQKKFIVVITLLALLLGVVYIAIVPNVYKAESYLLPPLDRQIQGVQGTQDIQGTQGTQGTQGITSEAVYHQFLVNLASRQLRRAVFQKKGILESTTDIDSNLAFESANRLMHVVVDKKDKELVTISFEWKDAAVAASVVNGLVRVAANKTKDDLFAKAYAELGHIKHSLENNVSGKRSIAKRNRLDRIHALHEALVIAKQLNISGTDQLQGFVNVRDKNNIPLYLMGEKALSAELMVLKNRENDDSFIDGLRDLQEKLAVVKGVKLEKNGFAAVRVDQEAFISQHPVKPKKALIIILAVFLGLMLGLIVAFVRHTVRKSKEA